MRAVPAQDLYEAIFDDEAFARLPHLLAKLADARSALIMWRHHDGGHEVMAFNHFSAEFIERYPEFAAVDPWMLAAQMPGRQNRIFCVDEVVTSSAFEKSVVFNELIRPQGDDTFHCMGTALTSAWGAGVVGVHRGRCTDPFEAIDAVRVNAHLGELHKVLRVRGEIASLKRESHIAKGALDGLATPVLVVARDHRIVQANTAAEAVLRRADGLCCNAGRLNASSVRNASGVNDLIARATAQAGSTIASLRIDRGPDLAPYLITAIPLPGAGRALATLIFRDPDAEDAVSLDRLRTLFGLTPAEAAVASDLAHGRAAADIAALRGVSANTIWVQIKSIANKLGARRQPEIVAKIAALPPIRGENGRD